MQLNELSKGKGYITEGALRKWGERNEIVTSGLASQAAVDSYLGARVYVQRGRVGLEVFKSFITMLDTVLMESSGNVLGLDEADRAVDISGICDADIEVFMPK